MQQALVSPVFRSIALAGLMLGVGVAALDGPCDLKMKRGQRLVLHSYEAPNALYLTAWKDGDVRVWFDSGELVPMKFTRKAYINDGCRWMARETLTPVGDRYFQYAYEETLLSCEPGATPCVPTPRTGVVTVED